MKVFRNNKTKRRVIKKKKHTRKYKGGSTHAANKLFAEFSKKPTEFSLVEVRKRISKLNEKSVNKEDKQGSTLLKQAIRHGDEEIVKLLLEKGADIHKKGNFGWTPLHSAVEFGNVEAVKLLLEKGAKTDITDGLGYTPLEMAQEKLSRKQIPKEIVILLEKH